MPLYHESYWISCNVNDALGWSYICMLRSHFCSHHMPIILMFFPLQQREESEGGPPCNSMPLVRLGLTILKFSYLLVRHRKWLYTRLNKVTLCFCFGSSRQSLKVREVKCIPRDPAITYPVLFKGSCSPLSLASLSVAYCTLRPYLVRWYLVFCWPCCVMLVGTALCIRLLVYAGLSLFIIGGLYVYMVVCVVYAYNLTQVSHES